MTHSLGSDVGLQQLRLFAEEGVSGERVAIGHADTWPEAQYHRALLELGATLIFFFVLLAFVGGCSGSTAGGLKIFRFQVAFVLLRANLQNLVHPR